MKATRDERWLPIPGMDGRYDVSDQGNVRSWVAPGAMSARLLKPEERRSRLLSVTLTPVSGSRPRHFSIHRLVMLAFVGPPPADRPEVRHLDGDASNNALANLAYGTHSENEQDKRRHGTHANAKKEECSRGHKFTPENTMIRKRGEWRERRCITCYRARYAA